MNIFESKYTLGITLGLVCFQMYLTKSSVVDYSALSSRAVASSSIKCKTLKDMKELKTNKDRLCLINKKDLGEGKVEISLYYREKLTGAFQVSPKMQTENKEAKIKETIVALLKDGNFSEIPAEDGTLAVTMPEKPRVKKSLYTKTIRKYKDLRKKSKRCEIDSDAFSEATEIYTTLLKDADEEKEAKQKTVAHKDLDDDQHQSIQELADLMEGWEDDDDFMFKKSTLEGRTAILECKAARIEDEDFLEDYKCKSRVGTETTFVPFTQDRNETGSFTSSESSKQECYYKDEILPEIRRRFARGDRQEFDSTYELLNDVTRSIDNQAVKTSFLIEHNNATYIRSYQDYMNQQRQRLAQQYPNSPEARNTMINALDQQVRDAFGKSRTQVENSLAGRGSKEIALAKGSYDYWGAQLLQIKDGKPIGIEDQYLNTNNGLLFGTTLKDSQKRAVITANEEDFKRITEQDFTKDAAAKTLNIATRPIVGSERPTYTPGIKDERRRSPLNANATDLFDIRQTRMGTRNGPTARGRPIFGQPFYGGQTTGNSLTAPTTLR